jgi:hypothetical protein
MKLARSRKLTSRNGLYERICDWLRRLAGGDDPERSIAEFKTLSGRGDSGAWSFNRDEIHERTKPSRSNRL